MMMNKKVLLKRRVVKRGGMIIILGLKIKTFKGTYINTESVMY